MATASSHASAATLISARAEHIPELGRICYEAFKDLQDRHRFLVDFPSVQLARQVIGLVVTRPEFYGVAAMSDGELVGSNFLTVVDEVAGVGPITVDPAFQGRDIGRQLILDALWREHAYGFVAYEGDMPVSTATAIINEECLFLFMVATAPDAPRKGYGEAVMRHAFRTAHEATGIRRSVLHATELGYPRISTSWIPPNCEVHGMHVGVLRSERGLQRSFHVALPD